MNSTKAPILSVAYLPPVSYFFLLYNADKVYIEQHETYPKQTYRNRCEIYTEKGKTILTIPVSKPNGNKTKTQEVGIYNEDSWFVRHWRTIEIAYSASPYFLYYSDELKAFYNNTYNSLLAFDLALIHHFCDILEIETPILLTEAYIKKTDQDFRDILTPKKPSIIKNFPEYTQVFNIRHGFLPNLSILDLLFNLGPESADYISSLSFD